MVLNFFSVYMCVHVCVCINVHAMTCVWRSEDNLGELVLLLSWWTLSHLAGPNFVFLREEHFDVRMEAVNTGTGLDSQGSPLDRAMGKEK